MFCKDKHVIITNIINKSIINKTNKIKDAKEILMIFH